MYNKNEAVEDRLMDSIEIPIRDLPYNHSYAYNGNVFLNSKYVGSLKFIINGDDSKEQDNNFEEEKEEEEEADRKQKEEEEAHHSHKEEEGKIEQKPKEEVGINKHSLKIINKFQEIDVKSDEDKDSKCFKETKTQKILHNSNEFVGLCNFIFIIVIMFILLLSFLLKLKS